MLKNNYERDVVPRHKYFLLLQRAKLPTRLSVVAFSKFSRCKKESAVKSRLNSFYNDSLTVPGVILAVKALPSLVLADAAQVANPVVTTLKDMGFINSLEISDNQEPHRSHCDTCRYGLAFLGGYHR